MTNMRILFAAAILSALGVGLTLAMLYMREAEKDAAVIPPRPKGPQVETRTVQVFPDHTYAGKFVRSKGQNRAVLLIHGLRLQLNADVVKMLGLSAVPPDAFAKADFSDWQRADSPLVSQLRRNADVFSFAYGQNVSLEKIAEGPGLARGVQQIKSMGYAEIILMGHSAGGVLARLFVEDNPLSGVTKVIQICVPNGGSFLAEMAGFAPKGQKAFVQSLTEESRKRSCQDRKEKKIPTAIQFVCVVGTFGESSDGVVRCRCQWPQDLQEEGIPAVELAANHFEVMSNNGWPKRLSLLVHEQHPRWNAKRVRAFRLSLAEKEVSREGYVTIIQLRATKAQKEANVEVLVACAYALAPYASTGGIKEPLSSVYLKQAAQITLGKNNKQDAERFLEITGILQGFLPAETRDKVTTLACGKNLDTLLESQVIASLGPITKAGRDFFDPNVVTREDDRDIAAAFGKAMVLAVRPTARIDGLSSYKIGPRTKSETKMEIAMDFHGGTTHRALMTVTLSYEKNRVRISRVVYEDDWQVPWELSRIEKFKSQFNRK